MAQEYGGRRGASRAWMGVLLLLAALLGLAGAARAEGERILAFDVVATLGADGMLEVTESILVETDGTRRGLLRDIPLRSTIPPGLQRWDQLRVLGVARNGAAEPYAREPLTNGLRLRIGQAAVVLPAGPHRFDITYRIGPWLRQRGEEDELFWNVTGQGWPLPIERASFALALPPGVSVGAFVAFTGARGETGQEVAVLEHSRRLLHLATTRPLAPGEGFSLAAAWPAGAVERPGLGARLGRLRRDNPGLVLGTLLTLGAIGFFVLAWVRVGRDPPAGPIAPRPEPPPGLSPVAAGVVQHRGFVPPFEPGRALAVALTSLAVKRRIHIHPEARGYTLEKTAATEPALPPGEAAVLAALFPEDAAGRLHVGLGYEPRLGAARGALLRTYGEEHRRTLFRANTKPLLQGGAIAAIALLMLLLGDAPGEEGRIVVGFFLLFALVASVPFVFLLNAVLRRAEAAGGGARGLRRVAPLLPLLPLALLIPGLMLVLSTEFVAPVAALMAVLPFGATLLFWHLLRAPTRLGRDLLDAVEGYRRFLLGEGQPPAVPPEAMQAQFERHLPYAMALGVEAEWTGRFAAPVSAAATAPAAERPDREPVERWRERLPAGFGAAAAASSSAPAASAASGSALSVGSVGGGSGGGGGGLW